MNYFPPNNTKATWTYGDNRLALYKNWYMSVSLVGNKYEGRVWNWKPEFSKKKKFNTEEQAVRWCENEVEFRIYFNSVIFHTRGSGI